MALTTLDPNTALIIVDLQKGIIGARFVHAIDEVVMRASALADKFRALGLPVVLVNVTGTAPGRTEQPPRQTGPVPVGWTDFIPELNQQPDDIVVTKRTWGAFASTHLEAQLRARRVTQVVVAGVATGQQGGEGDILRFVFFHSIAMAVLVGVLVFAQASALRNMIP